MTTKGRRESSGEMFNDLTEMTLFDSYSVLIGMLQHDYFDRTNRHRI
jgi:hypothetical protein